MSSEKSFARILIRATNWVGDAVMCLPALRAIRESCPKSQITILARPWVADIYEREPVADEILPLNTGRGAGDWTGKWLAARQLRLRNFDCAILFQNAFEAALLAWMARIPRRIGYDRDGRKWLLTDAIEVPAPGEIPRHERFYYLEMLRRASLISQSLSSDQIRLDGAGEARAAGARKFAAMGFTGRILGVSPGAAFGTAKRWIPDRFASAAVRLARETGAVVAVFGSAGERDLCDSVVKDIRGAGITAHSFAGETSLREFIELAAVCDLYLTNDSGAMHISSALGVPTVAIFGATDHETTGPTGSNARIVREPVDCSPCLLRECPIDHRCMTRVSVDRVVDTSLDLLRAAPQTRAPQTR